MNDRLTTLKEYLRESPDDPFLLFAIAQEYVQLSDVKSAREHFQILREKHPEYVGLYYHFGKLEQKVGRTQNALILFDEGLHIAKSIGDVHAWSELNAIRNEILDD